MIKRRYCERWDSYYKEGYVVSSGDASEKNTYIDPEWLESTGCGKPKSCKKCRIKCFNRPKTPCMECSGCENNE